MRSRVRRGIYPLIACVCLLGGGSMEAQTPAITSGTLPNGAVGTPYPAFTFTASQFSCSSDVEYTWSSPDLPSWATLIDNDDNETANFTGTPTAADVGFVTFTVKATETNCSNDVASQQYTINISSPAEVYYVLNSDRETALSIVAINGGMTVTCSWGDGGPCASYNTMNGASDFAVDSSGNFIVATGNAIVQLNPSTGHPATVVPLSATGVDYSSDANFFSVALDANGNYIVADNYNSALWSFPKAGGAGTLVGTFSSSFTYEDMFVRIDGNGNYIVVEDGAGNPGVQLYKFLPCTTPDVVCPQTPAGILKNPTVGVYVGGFAFDTSGNYVITWFEDGRTVVETVTPRGEATELYGNYNGSLESGLGIFRDPQTGNFLIADIEGQALYALSSAPANGTGIGLISESGPLSDPISALTIPSRAQIAPPTAPVPPLLITGGTLPSGFAYESYSASVGASGGVQPYTFAGSGFPAGIGINQYGSISGVTTATGNFSVVVTVTDQPGVSASATYTLAINPPPPVSVAGGTLTSVVVQTPVSLTLSAAGGGPPYTWSLVSGSLPPGLALQPSGTLLGTPLLAGPYSFVVRATDTFGGSAAGSFSMTILPPPLTPTSPSTLPTGMVTVNYGTVTLTARGGVPPYQFAITSGTLPAGLTLAADGAITGTPTAVTPTGGDTFTVTVTDSATPPSTGTAIYTISVVPFSADLILSSASVSFSLAVPANTLPLAQSVAVQSSEVNQTLGYSVAVSPASATWLSVTSSGTATPGSFAISLTSAALSLAPAGSPYTASVTATCNSGPCSGKVHTVTVTLAVTNEPAHLTVLTSQLSFNTTAASPQTSTQSLGIENTGGGTIGFASVTCGAPWCTVSGVPSSIGAGVLLELGVTANPAGLSAGYYWTDVSIVSSGGNANVPVTLLIAANGTITLGPAGAEFTLPQGGAAVGNTSFLVSVSGSSPVAFSAAVTTPSASWLSVTTSSGTASGTQPATVNLVFDPVQVAALTAGTYYATVGVSSQTAANSPQAFEVVLNVTPSTQATTPNPVPGGLIYLTQATLTPPAQTVSVYTGSPTPVTYQASASTNNGGNWLTVSPIIGTTSASAVGVSTVTANPAGLAAGVYTGTVSYQFSATAVRSVNVTMVVENVTSTQPGTGTAVISSLHPSAVTCTASVVVPTSTALVSNFAAPAAWPIELAVNLVDDCGSPINNGQIVATFSNGDPPLILSLTDATGDYVGTWTPQHASNQISVNALATAPPLQSATLQLAGEVTANNAPLLATNSIANFYNPVGGAPLAPGTLVQITGQYLAGQTLSAPTIPLPSVLGGTSVIIGGLQAPISSVSPGLVNAQVPFELPAGQPYQIIVNANNALTTPQSFEAGAASPGLSVLPNGYVQATHGSGAPVTETAPAAPGEYIAVYLVGMGATTIPVASGQPGPGAPYASTLTNPVITVNGENASFNFSGLIPGLVGVYQVNLQVPSDAPNGDLVLTLSADGLASNSGLLPVQN